MSAHDPIQNSERPSLAPGLLVLAANRRKLEIVLNEIPVNQFADTIREHLVTRFGAGRADAIINDMARGLLFK